MTIATMPTTWSLRMSRSWRAFRQPWFHHSSGRCFLHENKFTKCFNHHCNQLTFYSLLRRHIRSPHKRRLKLRVVFCSMTLAPTYRAANFRWNTNPRKSWHHSTADQPALYPRWSIQTVKSFRRDQSSCNVSQFHPWCPWWGHVKCRNGRQTLKRRQWIHSRRERWWVKSTAGKWNCEITEWVN